MQVRARTGRGAKWRGYAAMGGGCGVLVAVGVGVEVTRRSYFYRFCECPAYLPHPLNEAHTCPAPLGFFHYRIPTRRVILAVQLGLKPALHTRLIAARDYLLACFLMARELPPITTLKHVSGG